MGYKWGVGFDIQAGIEYIFKSGITISVTPRGQWNWLNVTGVENSYGMDVLSQLGVNIGVGYKFGK